MYSAAAERVEVCGEYGDKGFSFARFHLGDASLVQNYSADELYSECVKPENAFRRFTDGRKRFGKNIIERLSVFKTRFKLCGLSRKLVVGKRAVRVRKRFNFIYKRNNLFNLSVAVCAENLCYYTNFMNVLSDD